LAYMGPVCLRIVVDVGRASKWAELMEGQVAGRYTRVRQAMMSEDTIGNDNARIERSQTNRRVESDRGYDEEDEEEEEERKMRRTRLSNKNEE
jgi:hypothetical protein